MKNVFYLFSAAGAANNLQKVQTALNPKIDVCPSTFSKHVDNSIENFKEEPVTCLGLWDPSILIAIDFRP